MFWNNKALVLDACFLHHYWTKEPTMTGGNLKGPFTACFYWPQLLLKGPRASSISAFWLIWHFRFLVFLHSAISGISAFCNFWQHFHFCNFWHFRNFWKFLLAVFSFRLHWCLWFYFVLCFLDGQDEGVWDVEYEMVLLFRLMPHIPIRDRNLCIHSTAAALSSLLCSATCKCSAICKCCQVILTLPYGFDFSILLNALPYGFVNAVK